MDRDKMGLYWKTLSFSDSQTAEELFMGKMHTALPAKEMSTL